MIPALLLLLAQAPTPATPDVACPYEMGPSRDWCLRKLAEAAELDRKERALRAAGALKAQQEKEAAIEAANAEMQANTRRAAEEAVPAPITKPQGAGDWLAEVIAETPPPTPEEMQAVWSARICDRAAERAASIAEIKKEHRYSKIGGVVHLGRLGELQDDVASADDDIIEFKGELKAIGKRALSCKNPRVAEHRQ